MYRLRRKGVSIPVYPVLFSVLNDAKITSVRSGNEKKKIRSRRVSVWYTQQTHFTLLLLIQSVVVSASQTPPTFGLFTSSSFDRFYFLQPLQTVCVWREKNSFFQCCCCCCCVWSQRKKVWPPTDGRRRHNMKMVFFSFLLFLTLIFFWEEQNIQEIKKNSGKKRFHLSDPKRERGVFIPQEENSLALSKTLWV